MGLSDKKQTTNSTSTGTYSGTTSGTNTTSVPDTPDIIAARNNRARIDPSIGYRLGENQRQLNNQLANPQGGYMSPGIRSAIQRSQSRLFAEQAGQQTREGQYDVNRINSAQNLALAGITRGTVGTNTGTSSGTQSGTGSGTTVQSQSPWNTVAQIGASAAPLSL